MQITVVIVVKNNSQAIASALYGVYQHPSVVRCMVVDNDSTDQIGELIESQFPEVQLIHNDLDMGFGAACNQALLSVNTELALILDSSATIQSSAINHMIKQFVSYPQLALINCARSNENNEAIIPPSVAMDRVPHSAAMDTPEIAASGAVAMMRMEYMRKVGFYNPAFFLNHADEDILSRIRQRGYESIVLHEGTFLHVKAPHVQFLEKRMQQIKERNADPTLPVYDYWQSRFDLLADAYKAKCTLMEDKLDKVMQSFKQQEQEALADHKLRIDQGLEELHKVPKSNPKEQARWDAILQEHQDDWQETVKKHEKAVNRALAKHGKAHDAINEEHDKRWKALEHRRDEYLKAFSRAGRALTPAKHSFIFAINPEEITQKLETIAVAIITYKRADLLEKALLALKKIIVPPSSEVKVFIIDNDTQQSAKSLVKQVAKDMPFAVEYTVEETQGIPHARNKALELAKEADYLAFIDDDDTVDPYWLCFMLETARIYHADVVMGEVKYRLKPEYQHLTHLDIFRPTGKQTGQSLSNASTNNVLFATSLYKHNGLSFDSDFIATGGSDHHFFRMANEQGARIVFCAEGVVNSPVPAKRTSWRWIMRRYIRYGAIRTISHIKHEGYIRAVGYLLYQLMDSSMYFFSMLWWALLGKQPFIHPMMILCYMAGCIVGLAKISPHEYKQDA